MNKKIRKINCSECGAKLKKKIYSGNGVYLGYVIFENETAYLVPVGNMTGYMLEQASKIIQGGHF